MSMAFNMVTAIGLSNKLIKTEMVERQRMINYELLSCIYEGASVESFLE